MADRYLLESGSPDGYLLEDSSGVLLLQVPPTTKWDSANKSANITLSNDDFVATSTNSGAIVLATTAKTTGKWYFEVHVTLAADFHGNAVGLADSRPADTGTPGSATSAAISYHGNGLVYRNSGNDGGGNQATYESPQATYVIGVAFDADADKVWFAKANTYSGDPGAGTGGHAPTGITNYYPLFSGVSGDSAFIKTTADSQTYAAPTGFTAFDDGTAGSISGTSTVAFSTAGILTGAGALLGSTAPTFTTAGNLAGSGALSGASTVAFTTTATGALVGAMSGSATVAFTTAGAVTGAGSLSGASAPAFTTSGALTGSGALSGASSPAFTTTGVLSGTGVLAGATSVAFTTAGAVTGSGALSGSSAVAFTLSGALDQPSGSMSGVASVAFSTAGVLTGAGSLSGSVASAFALSAALAGQAALSGASTVSFTTAGVLTGTGGTSAISGSASFGFTATGTLLSEIWATSINPPPPVWASNDDDDSAWATAVNAGAGSWAVSAASDDEWATTRDAPASAWGS